MDKGAHFYRSDFQIHSPRDRLWVGPRPVTQDDRFAYAQEFVKRCRDIGLQAIAITDHHDICFIPYFQAAAQNMSGIPEAIKPDKQNPVVFPGVEITLQVPCQVIILLDADADQTVQYAVLQTLNLTHEHRSDEAEGPHVSALPFQSIEDLRIRLEEEPRLKGRFIILPHVSKDGHKGLLREGFHQKYATMSCVGGYIEESWDTLRAGDKIILDGGDPLWGKKAIGVFQTSDYRGDLANDIGCRSTWVKMAEFTAEAIRQACLARESRICQTEPILPTRYISRIEVSNSSFMGKIDIELNSELNAIIGGRGTGKSTILEYLRWAMQDQPVMTGTDIEYADGVVQKRLLIQETLQEANGIVKVYWCIDEVAHVVTADSSARTLTLQVGQEGARVVSAEEVRDMFPIRAYSQKQLSSVGIRTLELQRFIEQPIQDELKRIESEIEKHRETLSEIYSQVLKLQELRRELAGTNTRLLSLKERIEQLQKALPKLKPETETVLSEHAPRLREKQVVEFIIAEINRIRKVLANAEKDIGQETEELSIDESSPQKILINAIYQKIKKVTASTKDGFEKIKKEFEENVTELKADLVTWRDNYGAYIKKYEDSQREVSEHREKIKQLGVLQVEEAEVRKRDAELKQAIKNIGDPEQTFNKALDFWVGLHKSRGDTLEAECKTLMEKSGGYIEALLVRGADIDKAIEKLRECLTGARITEPKWNQLRDTLLTATSTVEKWREFIIELRVLAEMKPEEVPADFVPNSLKSWDLTNAQRRMVMEKLTPESWLKIVVTSLKDMPNFFYKKANVRIPFKKASAGEQATALLTILLNETGGPLIIDQPEDDLNKELTYEIVKKIWETKKRRQMIIASHDANLVVNGDAELIIHCGCAAEENRSKGEIKNLGAIDNFEIRETITKVMEGGKRAFELRKEKYGF